MLAVREGAATFSSTGMGHVLSQTIETGNRAFHLKISQVAGGVQKPLEEKQQISGCLVRAELGQDAVVNPKPRPETQNDT
jgi:hypothetical protein